jgi:alkylglycerol monooxygenase
MEDVFSSHQILNYAALSIPAFFLFVGLEYAAAIKQKRKDIFKFGSSIANLSIGIAERLINLFLTASFYGVFVWIYTNYKLADIPNHWIVWIALLFATDFVWYWYHRLGHEVNLLWAAHIVHHHSEEFNYTVSARITTLQAIIRNVFWCILPFAGFHPAMVMTILIVHGTYSFFTHTQLIGKLGWFEYVFITPSHHRVHHASNPNYLNKNYGDLFVFWDKMFGTFQTEVEAPVYGLTHPLKSHSFLWQHLHYFMEVFYAALRTKGFLNKLKMIFGKPELLDQSIRVELEQKFLPRQRYGNPLPRFKVYLVVQVILAVTLLFFISLFHAETRVMDNVAGGVFIFVTLINCGALLEQRRWIYFLEYVRLFVIAAYCSYIFESATWFMITTLASFFMLWPLKKWYLWLVYDIQRNE